LTPHQGSGHVYHTVIPIGDQSQDLPDELIVPLLEFTRTSPASEIQKAAVIFMTIGGAIANKDQNNEHTCIPPPIRQARYVALVECHWKPEFGDEGKSRARDWARTAHSILVPYQTGDLRYAPDEVNTKEAAEDMGFTVDLHERLGTLKAKYDPENFFRTNLNIQPKQ